MTTIIILGVCLLASIASQFLSTYFLTKEHAKEKKELHDRLMARDYPEFMQGKDFQVELDKKAEDVNNTAQKEKKLSAAEYADQIAAEQH